jgi:hypothetical protein
MSAKKQSELPIQMPGRIEELHMAALNYVAVRDQRMELTEEEVAAKAVVLELMQKHQEMTYNVEGVEITRILGEEKIKVKVHRAGEEEKSAA